MLFEVTPKQGFLKFSEKAVYPVLSIGSTNTGEPMFMLPDDENEIGMYPAVKFKYVKPVSPVKENAESSGNQTKRRGRPASQKN